MKKVTYTIHFSQVESFSNYIEDLNRIMGSNVEQEYSNTWVAENESEEVLDEIDIILEENGFTEYEIDVEYLD